MFVRYLKFLYNFCARDYNHDTWYE